jgi:hypothetical protein
VLVRARSIALMTLLMAVAGRRSAAQVDSTYDPFWGRAVHVSAAAGVALPTGQFRNNFEPAWDGDVTAAWPVVGLRSIWLEGAANYEGQLLTDATVSAYGARGGGASIVSGTINVVLNAPNLAFGRLTPFVVGGGGVYWRVVELDDYGGTSVCNPFIGFCGVYGAPAPERTRTQIVPGWDTGGGVRFRLSPLQLFVEARYNDIATRHGATTYVPIVVGSEW